MVPIPVEYNVWFESFEPLRMPQRSLRNLTKRCGLLSVELRNLSRNYQSRENKLLI